MKTTKTFIAALLCAVFAMPASFAEEGFYAGASYGTATDQFSCDDLKSIGTASCGDRAGAFRIHGGAKFSDNFAAEIGYIHASEHKFTGQVGVVTYDAKVQYSALDISLLGILPLNDSFSVHGRGGLAFWVQDASGGINVGFEGDGVALLYGLGGAFAINDNWSVGADWMRVSDRNGDAYDFLLAGVSYYF